jgi:DNA-binding MarR family transcriptional regulator
MSKSAAETRVRLERFLPYRLSVLTNRVSSAIAASYSRRFGLSIPEWRVMAVLADSPGLAASEVAGRTAMDKVAVSRAVATLLRAGRLTRRMARGDRRRSVLALTAAGAAVYAEVAPIALQHERELLRALAPADRAALQRILSLLLAHTDPETPSP